MGQYLVTRRRNGIYITAYGNSGNKLVIVLPTVTALARFLNRDATKLVERLNKGNGQMKIHRVMMPELPTTIDRPRKGNPLGRRSKRIR